MILRVFKNFVMGFGVLVMYRRLKKVLLSIGPFVTFSLKIHFFLPSQTETLKNHEPHWNALTKCFHAINKKAF